MIQQQFVLKENENRLFDFIDDLCKRINEAAKKEAIENIQKIIITEYDARHIYYNNINKALDTALNVVKKVFKSRDDKELFVAQYKVNKCSSLCYLLNGDEIESTVSESLYVKRNDVFFRVWQLSNGFFFHVMSGSEMSDKVVSSMRKYWNIFDIAHQEINVIDKGPEIRHKAVFYIDSKDIKDIDVGLLNKEKRAENLLLDYNIWSKEYHNVIKNGPTNTIYEETIFGKIAKQISCLSNEDALNAMKKSVISKMPDNTWNDILNEVAKDAQPVERNKDQRKTNILKTISILSGGLRR